MSACAGPETLFWLVLVEGVAIVLLGVCIACLAVSHVGCLRTVRQMQMPHRQAGDVPDAPQRGRGW